jgi:DNA ligase-associated metallophosphoesterase
MVPLSFPNSFEFSDQEFALVQGRALYWAREQALLVADLHLEKASFYARHGQMLPPYDSRETLGRLAEAIRATGARRVFTLGDNFHDDEGLERLEPHAAGMLDALTRAVDWVWITGNHDAELKGKAGGTLADELEVSGFLLRHQALPGETRPELSGHFHPKFKLKARGRSISRPCAVMGSTPDGGNRIILPAYGALTGGMDAGDPAIVEAMQPASAIDAMLATQERLVRFPIWRPQ